MKGAIFFSSKYGSTAQYANWISEATGLPVINMKDSKADPSKYDFLVLGSPVIYHKLYYDNWVKENWLSIEQKPIIFFTVSGAPSGPKLDAWIASSLPQSLIKRMKHVVLLGRQNPAELSWYDWLMLKIGGLMNKDPKARKEEMKGFDFMDKSSIKPVVALIKELQGREVLV